MVYSHYLWEEFIICCLMQREMKKYLVFIRFKCKTTSVPISCDHMWNYYCFDWCSHISNAEMVLAHHILGWYTRKAVQIKGQLCRTTRITVWSLTTMVIWHYGMLVLLHLSPVYTESTESSAVLAVMRCHYSTSGPHEISRSGERSVTNARLALAISIIQV